MKRSPGSDPHGVLQAYLDELLTSPEEPAATAFADPPDAQRERLQRLLYSAAPKSVPQATAERISPPVVVEPQTPRICVRLPEPRVLDSKPSRPVIEPKVKLAEPLAPPEPELPTPKIAEVAPQLQDPQADPVASEFRMKDVEWLGNGRPAWAQERFDVLLFKVAGLTLAVPLIALGQIQPLTDELTPLFGQVDWFMGLLPTPNGKVRTVNTAKFVMPERYEEHFVDGFQYVITIDGVPWGLAVDSVNQPISLDPEDVKWRTERSRRPWLAGTVKEHMCALLDIPRIGQLLVEADRKRA